MGCVNGCEFPDDLYFSVENNVWARREDDGSITVGMTSYACSLSGQLVAYTPKKAGKDVAKNKSCATVESGKWVGPAKSPVAGLVVAINDVLASTPGLINDDPYGAGWLVKIRPFDWAADARDLVTGAAASVAFKAKMDAEGFGGC
ncbi:MAG: glycine cleavage system protein H [Pseudomonadota bacterium]